MSGFVCLVPFENVPLHPPLLESLLAALVERGPDAQSLQIVGQVGLGHTLFRTTRESDAEQQPWTVGGREWIVADARLDAREDLLAALSGRGVRGLEYQPDVELILHSYRTWGDACVDRLLGDFAFAIWDGARHRLFCARDQIGVKPLFFTTAERQLLVSNTLDCLRVHPGVSDTLNEIVIADFLVVGANQDPATTIFADIQRVPAAHTLVWDREHGVRTRRYWTLPIDEPVRFRRSADYVEHFRELFGRAVADRLRLDRVGIFMSGGVDSTSVALAVRRHRSPAIRSCDLQAFTTGFDRLLPDREREYASTAARALDIPIHLFSNDDYEPYSHWDDVRCRMPEPSRHIFAAANREQNMAASEHSRVALSGYGGDPLFRYLTDVARALRSGRLAPVVTDVTRALFTYRRLPPIGIRTTIRAMRAKAPRLPSLPAWLDADFARRLRLNERYQRPLMTVAGEPHPLREAAREIVLGLTWPRLFESCDPAGTGCLLEYRHPFFDLRVISYILSIPPVPWSQDKELLRSMMQGGMPDEIRLRRKSPLAGDPLKAWCENTSVRDRLRGLVTAPRSTCCPAAFPPVLDAHADIWKNVRPLSLEYWLRTSDLSMA